jgi:hypothetical protein
MQKHERLDPPPRKPDPRDTQAKWLGRPSRPELAARRAAALRLAPSTRLGTADRGSVWSPALVKGANTWIGSHQLLARRLLLGQPDA